MDRNYDVIIFISKYFISRVAIFADIIKFVTVFIKTLFKYWKEVKKIRHYVSECNIYLYFLI